MRVARSPFTVALLAAALAGCSSSDTGTGAGNTPSVTSGPTSSTAAPPRTGITAEPRSSALQVQARDVRLVRVGTAELALQFEFVNDTGQPMSPDTLGIDEVERIMMLVDLPRATTYEMLNAQGLSGRLSENNGDDVPPGGAVTVTAVFPAPPAETTDLAVLIDGMLPSRCRCSRPDHRLSSTIRCCGRAVTVSRGPVPCSAPPTGRPTPAGRRGQ